MNQTKNRKLSLDLMKGITVFVMIIAHTIQFLGDESIPVQRFLSQYANMTCFTTFVFVFGAVNAKAYLSKDWKTALPRMGITTAKNLGAYYISAFAFAILIQGSFFMTEKIESILFLREIVGYSEFLLGFAVIQLIAMLFFPVFRKMNHWIFAGFAALSLLWAGFFPYDRIHNPILSLLTGTDHAYVFPAIPHLIFFAAGIWYVKVLSQKSRKTKFWCAVAAVLCSVPTYIIFLQTGMPPKHFSPVPLFLLGDGVTIVVYLFVCEALEKQANQRQWVEKLIEPLAFAGRNSLFYLLMSNLLLFVIKSTMFFDPSASFATLAVPALVVLAVCRFLAKTVR